MQPIRSKIRRIKFWWRLTQAYFQKYKLRVGLTILGFFLTIIILSRLYPTISQKNILNIGIVGSYTIETIPSQILSLATQPLISIDETGQPQPALAQNWTISDDGKTYVVFLKDNIKWHDQTDVDTRQISIAISNVKITYLNNKALKFDLENPLTSFLTILDKPVFKTNSFYGTGPERIVSIDKTDNKIVQKLELGDLVITADIPLANIIINKGGIALNPRGELYSKANIKERLSMRNFSTDLRGSGVKTGGPITLSKREIQNFANELDALLTKHK